MIPEIQDLSRDPENFLAAVGGLHDARITRLTWSPEQQLLVVSFDDLYSSFEGLPEYKGVTPVSFVFEGVSKINVSLDPVSKHTAVFECEAKRDATRALTVSLNCSPGGQLSVTCSSLRGERPA